MKCEMCKKEVDRLTKTSLESGQEILVCPDCHKEIRESQSPPWSIEIEKPR